MSASPLKDSHRRDINNHLKSLEELQKEIDNAKEAGIEGAEELQKRCDYCVNNLRKIKSVYFKGKP